MYFRKYFNPLCMHYSAMSCFYCYLLVISRSQIFLHKLIRMSRYTTKYYKICTIYQRSYLVQLFLIMLFLENKFKLWKWPLHCAPFGICYFKVAYEAQVHTCTNDATTQNLAYKYFVPLVFCRISSKNHKILFFFEKTKCECCQNEFDKKYL